MMLRKKHGKSSWLPRVLRDYCCLLMVMFYVLFVGTSGAYAKGFEEDQVKAVFLYNLTKFVSWPSGRGETREEQFCIGIVGEDIFWGHLQKAIENETVKGRPIIVKRFTSIESIDWEGVDLLFVSNIHADKVGGLISLAEPNQVLTVGDTVGFCQNGGVVNLLAGGKRVNIEVNVGAAKRSGLRISAQVLKLATLVTSESEVK